MIADIRQYFEMLHLNRLLDAGQRYTFSDYFDLPLAVRDILRGFDYSLEQTDAELPVMPLNQSNLSFLRRSLEVNQRRTRLDSELARRSAIIAPVLTEVCEYNNLVFDTEYTISVSPHLTGVVDYYIESVPNLLIVEAKQSDLVRGFKQLAVELIALVYWRDSPPGLVYGCVTDGERWQFACLDSFVGLITQYSAVYRLEDLDRLVGTLGMVVAGQV